MGKSSKKRHSTTEAKAKSKKSRYESDEDEETVTSDEENVSSDSESDNTDKSKNTKKASKSRGNKKRNETVQGGRGDDGEKSDESESDDETLINVAKRSKTSPLSGKDAESSDNESVATDTQKQKIDEVSESLIVFWFLIVPFSDILYIRLDKCNYVWQCKTVTMTNRSFGSQ